MAAADISLGYSNLHVIHVDNLRTDAYVEDGSEFKPYKTLRAALSSFSSATSIADFSDVAKRFYSIQLSAGYYDESAGGTLNVPFRAHVVIDFSKGATVKGDVLVAAPANPVFGTDPNLGNMVLILRGPGGSRPAYDNGQHAFHGIYGNLTLQTYAPTSGSGFIQLHLDNVGVRKVIETTKGSTGAGMVQIFCSGNSSFDTLKNTSDNSCAFYSFANNLASSDNQPGNIIGNILLQVIDGSVNYSKSIFPTASQSLRMENATWLPPFTELQITSLTRTGNVATATLSANHGASHFVLSDGYIREQYIIVKGVTENTTFNTPLYGALITGLPAANRVSYVCSGADVTTPVTPASARYIKGAYFGHATGYIEVGAWAYQANEAAIHTLPGWSSSSVPGASTAYIVGRGAGVQFRYPATAWTSLGLYVKNRLLTPGNGYQYRASSTGRAGTVQPTWPTTPGATVADGFITWTCETLGFVPGGTVEYNVQQSLELLHDCKNIYHNALDSGVTGTTVQTAIKNLKTGLDGKLSGTTGNLSGNIPIRPADYALNANSIVVASGEKLTVNSDIDSQSNKIRIRTSKTPTSAIDTGNAGEICWDADYVYVCVTDNNWKRSPIATWL